MKRKEFICVILCVAFAFALTACGIGVGGSNGSSIGTVSPKQPVETEPPVVTSVSGVMTAEEVKALGSNPDLVTADLSGSTCYDAIMEYIAGHPGVKVTYTVDIGGTEVPGSVEELDLVNQSYTAEALTSVSGYLPAVTKIALNGDAASAEEIQAISEAFPEAELSYSVTVLGVSVDSKAETLDLAGATAVTDELVAAIEKLPMLSFIEFMKDGEGPAEDGEELAEDGEELVKARESSLSFEDVKKIHEAAPQAVLDYDVTLYDQTFSLSAETLEYVKVEIGNDGLESFRELIPLMPALTYLKLDSCGIDYELLAQLRDDFPGVKVVWRVAFSNLVDGYNALTDTQKIWATGTVTDAYSVSLKYCTDVKYIDMGHNCITNIDFVNYMPNLEVAVFSITWIEDLSPLGNCPNLEFLEMYSTNITDVSALANCTNLKHLNLGNNPGVKDITPLYGLDLERCYINMNSVPDDQEAEFKALHPDCECSFDNNHPVHTTWRFLPGYYWNAEGTERHYNERYALLREQIGYDTLDYSK